MSLDFLFRNVIIFFSGLHATKIIGCPSNYDTGNIRLATKTVPLTLPHLLFGRCSFILLEGQHYYLCVGGWEKTNYFSHDPRASLVKNWNDDTSSRIGHCAAVHHGPRLFNACISCPLSVEPAIYCGLFLTVKKLCQEVGVHI